jgi:hypothetical protein
MVSKVLFMGRDNPLVGVLVSVTVRETDGVQKSTTEFHHGFGTHDRARERSVAREIYLDGQADELLGEVWAKNGTFNIGGGYLGRGSGLGMFR